MTQLQRTRVTWAGFKGGPGVSTFYSDGTSPANLDALRSFFASFAAMLPTGLTIQVAGDGDIIDDATGTLTGSWSGTQPAVVSGTGTGGYAGAVGGMVTWVTGTVHNGRRLKGRTFMVPLASGAFSGSGVLYATFATTAKSAADTLIAATGPDWYVWGRPGPKGPGTSAPISSAVAGNLVAVLRSRRD